jgi:tRNA(Ile)-lysidine synthase
LDWVRAPLRVAAKHGDIHRLAAIPKGCAQEGFVSFIIEIERSMSKFINQLQKAMSEFGLQNHVVLLAVSGGADSVSLLRGLHSLRKPTKLSLYAAHFNHQLRGDESKRDALWLQTLCSDLDVSLTVGSDDVRAVSDSRGTGIEETARELRYEFLCRTARELGCSHVAVAHTADDQVETILHHILRGTGLSGLQGMPRQRLLEDQIILVRPLLEITRQSIEVFLTELKQDFREDVTNRDESFTRNRIRRNLLPLLRKDYNPQVDEALLRLAQHSEDVQQALHVMASRLLEESVEDRSDTMCRINCKTLSEHPLHLIRECFVLLWDRQNWPRQKLGFEEWNRLAELVVQEGTHTFPGNVEARRRGNLLALRKV